MKTTVALKSGTVGEIINHDAAIEEGQTVTVTLNDENGKTITETGVVAEILESLEDWQ
ncbi:hypothetical protein [Kosakonia sacchari]|uniref:hypothetical protein n=1 Tax=Kosakonia sacchari TaxID=1158459 RepID=UPI0015849456|nr:hypothetical protein [Kosakonia sacchari]NUL35079.1 hypothetical protein [Kosakonia sacchari]